MEKRKHSDRCKSLPEDLPEDMDLMIEVSMLRRVHWDRISWSHRPRTRSRPYSTCIGCTTCIRSSTRICDRRSHRSRSPVQLKTMRTARTARGKFQLPRASARHGPRRGRLSRKPMVRDIWGFGRATD